MKPRSRSWTLLAAAAAVAAVTAYVLPPRPFTAPSAAWISVKNEVRGVFHVHTRRSDGTGTVDEVAEAAARAGLQFVIFTDHGDATRRPDPPRYRSGVLCIDAVEISTTGGHYAALGLGAAPYPLAGEPRDVAEDVRRLGGFGIATHPLSEKPDLAWRDWDVPVDAVEWLNGDSMWRDAPTSRLALAAWTYLVRPVASVARLYHRPTMLARWDMLALKRRVIALAGTDAHARLGFREGPEPYENPIYLKVPSYRVEFQVASLRVRPEQRLTRDATADAAAIVAAIRLGRVHTVVDAVGGGGVLDFTATSGGVATREGGAIPLSDPAVVRIRCNPPPGGWVVLFRNGIQVHRVQAPELEYASDQPGTYRAEVWAPSPGGAGYLPWIVGNPIVVGPVPGLEAAARPDTGGPASTLDEGAAFWGVEHDSRSTASLDREGGIGLTYALAASGTAAPFAAIDATTAIPPGASGVSFVARAARPMRVSVQVRVPAVGEGLRWQRSVYLDASPREVVVPFAEMTALGKTPAGPPRVSDIRTLLFVVDRVNAVAGSTGHFVLRDVRFFSPSGSAPSR